MSACRLIVHVGPEGPIRTFSVNLNDRAEAFLVAQRYDCPVELWEGDEKLCSIDRAGDGGLWVTSP